MRFAQIPWNSHASTAYIWYFQPSHSHIRKTPRDSRSANREPPRVCGEPCEIACGAEHACALCYKRRGPAIPSHHFTVVCQPVRIATEQSQRVRRYCIKWCTPDPPAKPIPADYLHFTILCKLVPTPHTVHTKHTHAKCTKLITHTLNAKPNVYQYIEHIRALNAVSSNVAARVPNNSTRVTRPQPVQVSCLWRARYLQTLSDEFINALLVKS